jgi:hypothetical protein
MKKLLLAISLLVGSFYLEGNCQISLSAAGTPVTENFNTLASTGASSTIPAGWSFLETNANSNLFYTAGTGSSNGGDTYSFGLAGEDDRTFGMLRSGNLASSIGASFKNETGVTITELKISYTGKTWRVGAANRSDKIQFSYSTDATGLANGTYVSIANLDYDNIGLAATGNGAIRHSANISYTIKGLNISAGTTFWIKFSDFDATGSDDGMGIDDFSITPNPTDPEFSVSPTSISFGAQLINTTSPEKSFVLNYSNLTDANTSVVTSAPFSISKTSNGTFEQSLSYTQAELNGNSTTIFVKYSPTVIATTNGTITTTGGGVTISTDVTLTGIGADPNFEINANYTQNFDDSNYLQNSYWKQLSVKGSTKTWEHTTSNVRTGTGAAYVNGFAESDTDDEGNKPSDDWLISPKMNLSAFTNYPIVSFWARKWFTGPDIKVYVSTTYNGSGSINLADWTEITYPGLPSTTGTWVKSNNLDLSAYKTAATYIAFRYVTTTASNSNAAEWRIDDFSLTNETATASVPNSNIVFDETVLGSTSPSKSFQFTSSGHGDITINAIGDFEISLDNISFVSTVTVLASEATSAKTIYARFKPTSTTAKTSSTLTFTGTGLQVNGPTLNGSSLLKAHTFDLVTWNMEFFGNGTTIPNFGPANRTNQIDNAAIIYNKMLPDVIGIQEVSDETAIDELLTKLPSTYKKKISQVYSYSIKANPNTDPYPAQKIGFIYNAATVDTLGFRVMAVKPYRDAVAGTNSTITDSFWSSGRLPFIGMFNVTTLDGLKKKVNVVVIHAKSGATTIDNARRKLDVEILKDSLFQYHPGENNAIIGDYNDLVEGSISAGQTSPFKIFTDNGYKALTKTLLNEGKGTYVGSTNPSMIDNIIVSDELNSFYVANSTEIEDARDYISGFSSNTSDHLPVLSRFSFPIGTLPVKFNDFTAKLAGAVVNLNWSTDTEVNNMYFTIERSADGKIFEKVKDVNAKGGVNEKTSYTMFDYDAKKGLNYYRLKQTDLNGAFTYFPELRVIKVLDHNKGALIHPNPIQRHVSINYVSTSTSIELNLVGGDGRLVFKTTGSINLLQEQLNNKISNLANGLYIISITDNGTIYREKIVKQ